MRFQRLASKVCICAFLLSSAVSAQAPTTTRVALVIGNSAYAAAPLPNPVNDARDMARVLRRFGFSVLEVRNGTRDDIAAALKEMRELLAGKNGVGMLYYAGHGLQLDARNYMLPVDARLSKATDIASQAIDVAEVIAVFRAAGNRMNILILDACRDNPFGSIVSGRGLAPLDAPTGTFLAYATAPGNVAADADKDGQNGLYTKHLLDELQKPHDGIEALFKRVRFAVRRSSNGSQIPWESTSLEEDFRFGEAQLQAAAKPQHGQMEASYVTERADWDRIKDTRDANDLYAFLQKYPNGVVSHAAQARLDMLTRPALSVQGSSPAGADQPYFVAKFRSGDKYITRNTSTQNSRVYLFHRTVKQTGQDELEVESRQDSWEARVLTTALYDSQGGYRGEKGHNRVVPPDYPVPSEPLRVGLSWKYVTQQETLGLFAGEPPYPVSTTGRISARERITVPAGTYDTFKVEKEDLHSPKAKWVRSRKCTQWFHPELPVPVKSNCTVDGASGVFRIDSELQSYSRAP